MPSNLFGLWTLPRQWPSLTNICNSAEAHSLIYILRPCMPRLMGKVKRLYDKSYQWYLHRRPANDMKPIGCFEDCPLVDKEKFNQLTIGSWPSQAIYIHFGQWPPLVSALELHKMNVLMAGAVALHFLSTFRNLQNGDCKHSIKHFGSFPLHCTTESKSNLQFFCLFTFNATHTRQWHSKQQLRGKKQ